MFEVPPDNLNAEAPDPLQAPILKLWLLYARSLPPGLPVFAMKNLRRAFYSGAGATFQLLGSPGDEEQLKRVVTAVNDEFTQFMERIGPGPEEF